MKRFGNLARTAILAGILLLGAVSPGLCQGDMMGLGDLLGGMGGMGGMGMLGALGGGLGGATQAPTTIIVSQPFMLVHGGSLYIAYRGKVTKFDVETLAKQAEAVYSTQDSTAPQPAATAQPPTIIHRAPPAVKPPLLPGATPSTGP